MKLKEKMTKFMNDRYGPDELYSFLFVVYILLLLINLFVKKTIISGIELALVFFLLFRFFSKNKIKRKIENEKYLSLRAWIKKSFTSLKRKLKDKSHIYKRCKNCKTILKLPLPMKYGIKHAKCPHCGHRLRILCLKRQKIEIMKTKERTNL